MKWTIVSLAAVMASLVMVGCGGGGSSDASNGGSGNGGSTGSTGGALSGPSSSPSPCAPNLCVNFAYAPVSAARLLTGSFGPGSSQALAGYSAHYSLTGGALPQGMSLDAATGAVHGTPTVNGFYDATVQLTVSGYSGSLSTHLGMEVLDPTLNFLYAQTPIGPQNVQFPAQVPFFLVGTAVQDASIALGIPTSYGETMDANPTGAIQVSYAVIGAQALPPGLSLNAATGAITGTPTQVGVWLVQVQAVGGGSTFTGWAPISVGPVIQEHIGQAAAAPVQVAVHAAAGVQFTSAVAESVGNPLTNFTYDESTNVMTVTPAVVPAGSLPGISEGALIYFITLPNGDMATAGYVEDVN